MKDDPAGWAVPECGSWILTKQRMTMSRNIALVTGGSRGIGRSTAVKLAENGVDVILTYLSRADDAGAVVAELERLGARAAAIQLDTGDSSQFASFADRLSETLGTVWGRQRFDYLVNNAGVGAYSAFAETSEETFDRMMDIHIKGVFFLTQRLLSLIEDGGSIVNISTGLTRFSFPGYSAYAAAKGAIEVLTRYLALELGTRRITVNTIAPGAIETDFGGGAVRDNAELNRSIASATALGRVGLPDDVGNAIASLLVGSNNWVTAQRIEVSGGQTI